jgi:1,2-diacylglycerol 3-alpha-glucosyltransferase
MKLYSVAMVAACPFPANYGTPGAIRELTETLSEMGHRVHVITYPFGQDLSVGNAKLHRVGPEQKSREPSAGPSTAKIFLDLQMLREICRVVRDEKIDLIHAHNYEGALLGLFAKVITGRPMIYNAVNLMSDELATYRFIRPAFVANWIAKLLDWFVPIFPNHIIAVTTELYQWLVKRGVPPEKVSMIPCGMRPAMFANADPNRFRAKYGISSEPIVMYTGINNAFQRIDLLLRAFSVVLEQEPSARLLVVSPLNNEPDLPANQALARELGIADRVTWIGPHTLAELPDYIAMATVTVVPRTESPGHPIKLLNYMISGRPIVCFAGAAKGVTHLHDALLVPDHDWRAMGQAIVQLVRDSDLAKRLGANARETAINNFDWELLSAKVADVYGKVLSQPTKPLPLAKAPVSTG